MHVTVLNRPVVRVKRNHSTHTFSPFVLHTSPLNEREVVMRGQTTQSRSAVALRPLAVKCGSISMAQRSVKRYTAIPPRHLTALDLLSTHCRNKYPTPNRPITNVILKLLYWQPGWRKQSQRRSGYFSCHLLQKCSAVHPLSSPLRIGSYTLMVCDRSWTIICLI